MAAKLANLIGIKPNYRDPAAEQVTGGESGYSISSGDTYVEEEPTAAEWIRHVTPTGPGLGRWAYSLFPFVHWITRYNLQWLYGDLVAGKFRRQLHCQFFSNSSTIGITVGCVVVPQSMAYAKLAALDVQFGLYSSFMGVLIYWFFATSKDITIGVSI